MTGYKQDILVQIPNDFIHTPNESFAAKQCLLFGWADKTEAIPLVIIINLFSEAKKQIANA